MDLFRAIEITASVEVGTPVTVSAHEYDGGRGLSFETHTGFTWVHLHPEGAPYENPWQLIQKFKHHYRTWFDAKCRELVLGASL